MKALLIQVDGTMENLALMQISAWLKEHGYEVYFHEQCNPDEVYISCIFPKNRSKALGIATMFPNAQVHIGGSGVNYNILPPYMQLICPDYDLYDVDHSLGFTSRGCIRKCPWCIVPDKEGKIRDEQPLTNFLRHDKVILLDNNFLASPRYEENLQYLIDYDVKVNFNQGLDIRLINREVAEMLSRTLYFDRHFKTRSLYFAFDHPSIEEEVCKGIIALEKAGVPKRSIMFYVLVGFNTSYEEDLRRIKLLTNLGVVPYVMTYNDRRDEYYNHLERWVNRRYYQFIPWKNYDYGNSQEVIRGLKVEG